MLNSIQLLLVRLSATDGGLKYLRCGTDSRIRSGALDLSFVACELCQSSI